MSFTDQKPQVATFHDCYEAQWGVHKPGAAFRCYLCGKHFEPGDTWRWVYSRIGNFFTCAACDGPDVRDRFAAMLKEAEQRFWWLTAEYKCADRCVCKPVLPPVTVQP